MHVYLIFLLDDRSNPSLAQWVEEANVLLTCSPFDPVQKLAVWSLQGSLGCHKFFSDFTLLQKCGWSVAESRQRLSQKNA